MTPPLFRALGLADPELSIVLTDNDEIRELNEQWRDEASPTDVLSFPLHEPDEPGVFAGDVYALGDIVISLEYARQTLESGDHHTRVADELGLSIDELEWEFEDEILFLVIHGLLHLVGYDHASEPEETAMMAEERRLWRATHS